jgi:hypothetical protein
MMRTQASLLQVSFSSYSSECHVVMSGSELVGCHSGLFVQHQLEAFSRALVWHS